MTAMTVFKYKRISRPTQNLERQGRNIDEFIKGNPAYKDAPVIEVTEVYTGTKQDRPKWQSLLNNVKAGDVIIFDSVSRMSRNKEEGVRDYMMLFDKGVTLIFLKEPHINTDVYRQLLENTIKKVDDVIVDTYIEATNKVLKILAALQVEQAFEQAEKEVDDLHKRTSEGIMTAKLNGKRIGTEKGRRLNVKKANAAKEIIRTKSKDFNGHNTDQEVMKLAGICRNSFYKYKRELLTEMNGDVGK